MACDKYLESGSTAYPCYLAPDHEGPHAARELPRTERIRKEWEVANPMAVRRAATPAPAPGPRVPGALEALGMQGPPKTSVDGLTALEGRTSRREHPEERRRRLALEGEPEPQSIEERLVRNAGGVSPAEMQRLGMNPDPRYEVYDNSPRAPGITRSEDFLPPPAPPQEVTYSVHPSLLDQPMTQDEPAPLTQGERIMEILVDIQSGLNEIALIIAD
jgi:hypothetical protein